MNLTYELAGVSGTARHGRERRRQMHISIADMRHIHGAATADDDDDYHHQTTTSPLRLDSSYRDVDNPRSEYRLSFEELGARRMLPTHRSTILVPRTPPRLVPNLYVSPYAVSIVTMCHDSFSQSRNICKGSPKKINRKPEGAYANWVSNDPWEITL